MRKLALLLSLALSWTAAKADTIVAMSLDSKIYTINTVTGAATFVSDYGFDEARGLAYNPARNSYFFTANNDLYEFTLGNQPVFRRHLEFILDRVWEIAIDRAGVVWCTETVTSGPERIWRFGVSSGSTFIGDNLESGNLDFGADGSLYLWHGDGNINFDGLFVVNRHNGNTTRINPPNDPPNMSAFCTLDTFNSAVGQMFNGPFYSIRLFTGAVTLVGGPDRDLRSAAHGVAKKFPCAITLGAVNLGKVERNVEGCMEDRDGEPLRVCRFIVPNSVLPPIRYELTVNGPNSQANFDMIYRARMTTGGAFKMTVQAKRISTGAFEDIDTANLSTTYSINTLVNQASAPYLNGSGNGVFRIEARLTGPSATPFYCLELDQFVVVTETA